MFWEREDEESQPRTGSADLCSITNLEWIPVDRITETVGQLVILNFPVEAPKTCCSMI
jgi:hypothetical protein